MYAFGNGVVDLSISNLWDSLEMNAADPICAVCKRWLALGRDPCFTTLVQGQQLNAALSAAGPGDTILLAPGFYQEMVLIEKPVKLVGQPAQDIRGHDRRGVVIQTNRSMCILSNARHALLASHMGMWNADHNIYMRLMHD